ncbi:MAG: hypothetical protein NTY99_00650 [DPANN group archaeon]|nr:hypothetical protein [DPANN group archaeon]
MGKEQNQTAEAINWVFKRLPIQLVDNKNIEVTIETADLDGKPVEPKVLMRIKGEFWHAFFTEKDAKFRPKDMDLCDTLGKNSSKIYCPIVKYNTDLPAEDLNGLKICPHYYLCTAIEKFVEKYDREIKEINKLNNEKLDM